MLNRFKRKRQPVTPAAVAGSLKIRDLLEYPQLQAVMNAPRIVTPPTAGTDGAARKSRGRRNRSYELADAA